MDDEKLFPAYDDYLQGIATQHLLDGHDVVIIPDEASSSASIYSDGEVFGSVSMRPTSSSAVFVSRRPPSPAVLDLRLPSLFPDFIKLIPPEAVHLAPPALEDEDRTPAEPESRKLFGTPQQPAQSAKRAPTSSQQLLHNLRKAAKSKSTPRRRGRPRQATHPSLHRSASATDSETFQTASSSFVVSPNESPTKADKREPQGTPRLQQSSIDSLVVSKLRLSPLSGLQPARNANAAIIRPGELLNQGRFAVLPVQWRQQTNAQIAQMWNFANAHADPGIKQEALSRLAAVSAKIQKMLQDQEKAMHTQAQHDKQIVEPKQQAPEAVKPQLAHDNAQATAKLRTHVEKCFGRYLVALRMCQLSPPHNPTAVQVVNTYPAFRQSLNAVGLQYLDTLIADAKTRENPLRIGTQMQANPNVQQPSTALQHQVKVPPQHASYQNQQASQNAYYHHPLAPQQQQIPREKRISQQQQTPQQQQIPQGQRRYSALLQAQREIPAAPVSDAVRLFVNENVPKYFEAVECLKQSPKTCDPVMHQKAHIFMDRFDKALPPQGHNYLMEIVRRVKADKSAGLYN